MAGPMVAFVQPGLLRFALFGIVADRLPDAHPPQHQLDHEPGHANGHDRHGGAHRRERAEIAHSVVGDQREDGDPQNDQHEIPDDKASLAGAASLWCLSGKGEHLSVGCPDPLRTLPADRRGGYSKAMPE